jgi:hypothetical protein
MFLSPFQGLLLDSGPTQGLRPGLQSVAASRLIKLCGLNLLEGCDGCHISVERFAQRAGAPAPHKLIPIWESFHFFLEFSCLSVLFAVEWIYGGGIREFSTNAAFSF